MHGYLVLLKFNRFRFYFCNEQDVDLLFNFFKQRNTGGNFENNSEISELFKYTA